LENGITYVALSDLLAMCEHNSHDIVTKQIQKQIIEYVEQANLSGFETKICSNLRREC